MDDTKRNFLTLLLVLVCLPLAARAVDLTYVTPAEVDRLQAKFTSAHLKPEDVQMLTKAKGWRCDLFGVRTRLQVRRDVDLYNFKAIIPTPRLSNSGAQPITTYAVAENSLRGEGDKGLVDEVRVSGEDELIAKLSIPERGVTVAYTVCHGS